MRQVIMGWQISNKFGWGIAGLNIFYHWINSKTINPFSIFKIRPEDLDGVDPLRRRLLDLKVEQSNQISSRLNNLLREGKKLKVEGTTVIHAMGNGFEGSIPNLEGDFNVGRVVFEDTNIRPNSRKLDRFDQLTCVSSWNAELLNRILPKKEIKVLNEAVDTSIFCPGPKSGIFDRSKFYIFSGGKIEYRKSQDLVLLAFREFSKKYDDAILVTCWHSPWVQLSVNFKGKLDSPLRLAEDGSVDIKRWVRENGVDPTKVIDVESVPNQFMPMILREMDCAIQPSRAEAGTNFVVKELMACGVPVIAALNTGMKDLLTDANCLIIKSKKSVIPPRENFGVDGWTEPQVSSIVVALEELYKNSSLRNKIAKEGLKSISKRTWRNHAQQLEDLLSQTRLNRN